MDNFSVRGRSVYHHPIADNDPDMSYPCSRIVGIKNQIPTLKIVKGYFFPRRILRKACRIAYQQELEEMRKLASILFDE